ncbi:hypothetical protein VNI00_012602 [Paramarasmius palmivorus]|uniref:F-box domain-containing protein n=1 Tax=Paramarasmius palmivorus TaxID=297713 RepID=A0AAW0C5W1_9AGAR
MQSPHTTDKSPVQSLPNELLAQIVCQALDFFPDCDLLSRRDLLSLLLTSKRIHAIVILNAPFHRISLNCWRADDDERCHHDPASTSFLIFLIENAKHPLELDIDLSPSHTESDTESDEGRSLSPTQHDDPAVPCLCLDILLHRQWGELKITTCWGFDRICDLLDKEIPPGHIHSLTRFETGVSNGDGGDHFPRLLNILALRQLRGTLSTATWGWYPLPQHVDIQPRLPFITTLTLYSSTIAVLPVVARLPSLQSVQLNLSFGDWTLRPEWRWSRGDVCLPHLQYLEFIITTEPTHHFHDILQYLVVPGLRSLSIEWSAPESPTTSKFFFDGIRALIRRTSTSLRNFTFHNLQTKSNYNGEEFADMLISCQFALSGFQYHYRGFDLWYDEDTPSDGNWGPIPTWGSTDSFDQPAPSGSG